MPGQRKATGRKQRFSTLRVAQTGQVSVPDKLDEAFEAGRKEATAKRRHKSGFVVEEFYWSSPSPFRDGQLIIQVYRNAHGRSVSPPGRVIHTRPYRNGKQRKTLIYVELPDRDWEPLSRFGKSARKYLSRGGVKNQSATRNLLALWQGKEVAT